MKDLIEFVKALGIDVSSLATGEDHEMWVDTMPNLNMVVTTSEEAAFPETFPDIERAWAPPEAKTETKTVVDLTARDVYLAYRDASPEEQRAFRERMYTSKMYNANVDPDEIDVYKNFRAALIRTADWAAFNGVDPWGDAGLPMMEMPVVEEDEDKAKRMSLAQIHSSADKAAGAVLGRRATAEERKLAVSIIRQFEADEQTPSGADLRSAFREGSPREAASRGMEQTMQLFQRIIGGR